MVFFSRLLARSWSGVLAKEVGNRWLLRLSPRNREHKFGVLTLRSVQGEPINFQEDDRGNSRRTLVTIQEGMVLRNVKEISGCHLENVAV